MSEIVNPNRKAIRRQLLVTASAFALLGYAGSITQAAASDDNEHPTVWIELGGQWTKLDAGDAKFVPPFLSRTSRPSPETVDPLSVGHPPRSSFDGEGKIAFEPSGSNWVFSVGVRYGRSSATQHLRQQSYPTKPLQQILFTSQGGVASNPPGAGLRFRYALQFMDTKQQNSESHTILDFQAGKDVGLGMFGGNVTSVLSLGVRFAQFGSKTDASFKSDPDAHPLYFYYGPLKIVSGGAFHSYAATAHVTRSFHGIGPSLSWNATAPFAGNRTDGELTFDWGANAAILFGRQKTRVHHQTTARYFHGKYRSSNLPMTLYHASPPDQLRSRTAVVPNIGGFAGMSFNLGSGKVSLGYRADFFFGAMDGGFDKHKSESRGFYGPFANISIGLGG